MRKTWGMVFAVILVVVISLAGCSKKAEGPEGKAGENEPISQIRIGYIAMPLTSPQKLIEDESQIFADLLREDDIEVEWVQTRSRDNTGEMKDKLEVDFFYLPAANYSTYFTETSDFGGSDNYRIIAGSTFNNSYVLIGRPGVEKLDDLDGKTVGVVNHSYMEEFMLNKQLETVGLKTAFIGGSVTIEHTDWMKTFQENFETGAYDAVVAWTSNQEAYLKRVEGSKVITNLNEGQVFGTHAPHVWLLARKDYIEQRPELVKTVLKAHVRATAEAQKKSKESLAESAMLLYDDYFENVLKAQEYPKYPLEIYVRLWQDAVPTYDPGMSFIKEEFAYMSAAGHVKDKTVENMVSIKLLNEVLKEEGLAAIPE